MAPTNIIAAEITITAVKRAIMTMVGCSMPRSQFKLKWYFFVYHPAVNFHRVQAVNNPPL
jgi:hypothetical protein